MSLNSYLINWVLIMLTQLGHMVDSKEYNMAVIWISLDFLPGQIKKQFKDVALGKCSGHY